MKYQVVFLASPWKVDELKASMEDFPDIVFVTLDEMDSEIPTLYLYYGCSPKDASVSNDMEAMLRVGVDRKNVQPIAKNPDDFKTNFPPVLKSLNGFFLSDTDFSIQALKNLIISFFGIIDGNRKVFISYRRTELEILAHKLFDLLVQKKYYPFLDSYSLLPGVDFQEYLRHELVDSDIVILLDSPDFYNSPYCMEELRIANLENIPVLDVQFQVADKVGMHQFCACLETNMTVQEGNNDGLLADRIIEKMERSRAASYSIKRKFVVDEFHKRCDVYGL